MAVNKVILIGNLGKDVDFYQMNGGGSKASFSIATNESYKDREGKQVTKTEWHNVIAWNGLARIAQKYLQKGKQVYVEGKLASRSYEDKTGVTRYVTEIVCLNLRLLGRRDDNMPAMNQATNTADADTEGANTVDDLPF